eukprot:1564648-Prymnesium_polylepis.1
MLLMVQKMVVDMLVWLVFLSIMILAFAASLHILYADTYDHAAARAIAGEPICDKDYDEAFKDWSVTVQVVVEVMLSADADYECLRNSSNSVFATVIMYIYVLATCVMLVNMLIALMAKTFDNVFEQQDMKFLSLRVCTHDPPSST